MSISAGPRFEYDIQMFSVALNFALEACRLPIVNLIISVTYIMHVNAIGEPLEFFFVFLIHFFEFSDGFSTLPKFALSALHFGDFERCVTCY